MEMESSFRILSLDGGGARGYLSARILANIEKLLAYTVDDSREGSEDSQGKNNSVPSLGRCFDLIVGTSTGAILAAGLALGISAHELAEIYSKELPRIFRRHSWLNPARWRGPKYDAAVLANVLADVLGEKTLDDVETDLCIVSVSLLNGQPRLYKSDYFSRNRPRGAEKLVDILLASAAAPTYFPPSHGLKHSSLLVDGGICANNPAIVGLIDAFQFERPSRSRNTAPPKSFPEEITLLSVGTGERPGLPYNPDSLKNAGMLHWVKPACLRAWINKESPAVPIIELLMESQVRLVEKQSEFLMKGGNYLRINPKLHRSYPLDDTAHLHELVAFADIYAPVHKWIMENLTD